MKYNFLDNTDIKISNICLGTMTFGQQNSESDGHAQLDFAVDHGINFVDTAEMYPVPAKKETYGKTEAIIGSWIKKSGKRNQIVLATKIAGANRGLEYTRENLKYNRETIILSVEKSLKRLQTDYIDLYQLHWPERKTNMFGVLGFSIQDDDWDDNIHEILVTLEALIKQGKIKTIGLSNETPWGLMRFLEEGKKHNLPKIAAIQNPYSLLNRSFEVGLSEVAFREKVGLLAYSPLGFGILSGKFLDGSTHPTSRLSLFPQFSRYNSAQSHQATLLYNEIAKDHNLTLTQLSLAFVQQQQMVSSTIIGATTLEQLTENIEAFSVVLSPKILDAIDQVQIQFPNPAP